MIDKPNLLIVDDNQIDLKLLEVLLRYLDINLISASSGSEALEQTKDIELALAIVDVRMPEMDGYELALKLNEERANEKVPVIFLTANSGNQMDVFKGYDSGAVDYIIKPINSQILRSKITVFLDLFKQKQSAVYNANLLKESKIELERVNSALKTSEELYRSYIDNAPDSVFIVNNNGKFIETNKAACLITGYTANELAMMSFSDVIQKSQNKKDNLFDIKVLINDGSSKSDLLFKPKNGPKKWWSLEATQLSNGNYLCFAKDITDRKNAEQELHCSLEQLHQLTQHVEKVRENERLNIARELHDDLGQALTAVKIDLGIIKRDVFDERIVEKVNNVSELVRETIGTVQRITAQLRPQIIDDLGLEAAIEWYTKEFAQRNNIEIVLNLENNIPITPNASLIVFRIMQESLTNVSRYSKASRVEIVLKREKDNVYFSVTDNGIGISDSQIKSRKSFGLIGMRERAGSLGGIFDIRHGEMNGTCIAISFPLVKCETKSIRDFKEIKK